MTVFHPAVLFAHLCRPGTLLDVGANFGQSAHLLLQVPNASVVAFEPVCETFVGMCALLKKEFGGRLPPNLTLHNVAVGAETGVAKVAIPYFEGIRWEGRASLAQDFTRLAASTTAVEVSHVLQDTITVPLDLFDFQNVTFLKIDVEGFENEVLRGAYKTIGRCRPVIHIEIEEQHRKRATIEVPALLDSLNYRGFFDLRGVLTEFERFDAAEMQKTPPLPRSGGQYPDVYVFEFIFIHREDIWALQRIAELAAASMLTKPT